MPVSDPGAYIREAIAVTREDIARAKGWLMKTQGGDTLRLASKWLAEQQLTEPRSIDTDADDCQDVLDRTARAFSVRLAFFQAVAELVATGEIISAYYPARWHASVDGNSRHYRGGMDLGGLGCSFPATIERSPFASNENSDPDIFLEGINCKALHPGIHEAIRQSLDCFRRGLYMPATAMLAAAAEATWTECGAAVAKRLANPKLTAAVNDPLASIGKRVTEIRKALEPQDGKTLLRDAGQTSSKVADAEVWTTALRDRRNALHWTKAKSFVADHSETGTLLLAAPMHIGTLEAIRLAC
jgi:hypothetical protein